MFDFLKKLFNKDESFYLHGVDLRVWEYLGYCTLEYIDENGKTLRSGYFFGFCKKNNHNIRKIIDKSLYFENHKYLKTTINLWLANEYQLYTIFNSPSNWLKEYMLNKYNYIWDVDTEKWYKNGNTPKIKKEDNVISVNFDKT